MLSRQQLSYLGLSLALVFLAVLPVAEFSSSGDSHSTLELTRLMKLLGRLKDAHRARYQNHALGLLKPDVPVSVLRDLSDVAGDDVGVEQAGDFDDDVAGGLDKRQGAWSFDYGLGGGRFGKRDYGLGGGRFGRDVDHVDPHNDVDATS